jgi:hypothetical protein
MGSGGNDRPAFVGLSLSNGGGDISFGGSESRGFNFFSGTGGIRIGGSRNGITAGEGSCDGNRTGIRHEKSLSSVFESSEGLRPHIIQIPCLSKPAVVAQSLHQLLEGRIDLPHTLQHRNSLGTGSLHPEQRNIV